MALLSVCCPASAAGQEIWTEVSALGYGGIGFGAGLAACWSCEIGPALGAVAAGTVLGMIVGSEIGGSAERAASQGRRPSSAQLLGARVGTVTGFASLGALAAGLYSNRVDRGGDREDERNITFGALAGAVIGVGVEILQERRLPPGSTTPAGFVLSPGPAGSVVLGVRLVR